MLAIEVLCTAFVRVYEDDPLAAIKTKFRTRNEMLYVLLVDLADYAIKSTQIDFILCVFLSYYRIYCLLPVEVLPTVYHKAFQRLRDTLCHSKHIQVKDVVMNNTTCIESMMSIFIGTNYEDKFDIINSWIEMNGCDKFTINSLLIESICGRENTVQETNASTTIATQNITNNNNDNNNSNDTDNSNNHMISKCRKWYFILIQFCRLKTNFQQLNYFTKGIKVRTKYIVELSKLDTPMEYVFAIRSCTMYLGLLLKGLLMYQFADDMSILKSNFNSIPLISEALEILDFPVDNIANARCPCHLMPLWWSLRNHSKSMENKYNNLKFTLINYVKRSFKAFYFILYECSDESLLKQVKNDFLKLKSKCTESDKTMLIVTLLDYMILIAIILTYYRDTDFDHFDFDFMICVLFSLNKSYHSSHIIRMKLAKLFAVCNLMHDYSRRFLYTDNRHGYRQSDNLLLVVARNLSVQDSVESDTAAPDITEKIAVDQCTLCILVAGISECIRGGALVWTEVGGWVWDMNFYLKEYSCC